MDRYQFALGALVLIGLLALGTAIALGKVEEKTSYGLPTLLTILGKVAFDFSEACYRSVRERSSAPDKGAPDAKPQ